MDGGVRLCCPRAGQVTLKGQQGSNCTFHLPPVLPFGYRISASVPVLTCRAPLSSHSAGSSAGEVTPKAATPEAKPQAPFPPSWGRGTLILLLLLIFLKQYIIAPAGDPPL